MLTKLWKCKICGEAFPVFNLEKHFKKHHFLDAYTKWFQILGIEPILAKQLLVCKPNDVSRDFKK